MSIVHIIGSVLVVLGALSAGIASLGLLRFPDILSRMHAASKPQTFGLILLGAGAAILSGSWVVAGGILLVVLAQLLTITAASAMLGRAAFRRGFVVGANYAVDELTPRLAEGREGDDDDDGFLDEDPQAHDVAGQDLTETIPTNTLTKTAGLELAKLKEYWDEEEEDEAPSGSVAYERHPRTGEFRVPDGE